NEVLNLIASDTETRWNSTFFLLERLKYFHNTLSVFAEKLFRDSNRTTRIDGEPLIKLIPSSDNWAALEELLLLLQPFVDATNLTSGNTYPTLSLWYPTLFCLKEFLQNTKRNISSHQIIVAEQIENIKCSLKRQIELLEPPSQPNLISSTISITSTTSDHSMFIDYFNQNLSLQHITSPIDIEISLYLQLSPLL
ncbi:12553_t:CDS:2, partial [Racocetra persica]